MRAAATVRNSIFTFAIGAALMLVAGCVVEDPAIVSTDGTDSAATGINPVPSPTLPPVQFQPTPTPTAPTATPVPPTPEPAPTPSITPLPAITPTEDSGPSLVPSGLVAVPVGGTTTFVLDAPRPIMQLSGHTLIYLDDDRQAEVDVFTPVATGAGTVLDGYGAVIAEIETNAAFADVSELDAVTIAGLPTRVFEGTTTSTERGFYTDLETRSDDIAGWFPPVRVRMWVIETASGPLVVSAESLTDPGQYSDAVLLATEILSTISFS